MAAANKRLPERRLPVQQMCVLVSKPCTNLFVSQISHLANMANKNPTGSMSHIRADSIHFGIPIPARDD